MPGLFRKVPAGTRYLDVVVRVPVRVVDDDGVCTRQVDAQTPRPRGKQEAELLRARSCDANQHGNCIFTKETVMKKVGVRESRRLVSSNQPILRKTHR